MSPNILSLNTYFEAKTPVHLFAPEKAVTNAVFSHSSYYSSHFGISEIPGSFIGKDLEKYKSLITNLNTRPQNMSL